METIVLGLSHKSAPIEIREKLSFPAKTLTQALLSLNEYPSIEENIILSTCNRVEIYASVSDTRKAAIDMQDFLSRFHKIETGLFRECLYSFSGQEALRHLFRVASSLDSMMVGETQIFGQLKDAFFYAKELSCAGKTLNRFFTEALKIGKLVRSQTQIGKGAVSISSAAIELAKEIFEDLKDKKVLIIGAGKIAELAAENLYSKGAKTVLVANRTFEKAKELAGLFGGTAVKFKDIFEYLEDTDILISSTSAPHFIIKEEHIKKIMEKNKDRRLFLIDLGLPRNIAPEVSKINGVYLYNIDNLNEICEANLKERLSEAKKAEALIEKHLERLFSPAVKPLKEEAFPTLQQAFL